MNNQLALTTFYYNSFVPGKWLINWSHYLHNYLILSYISVHRKGTKWLAIEYFQRFLMSITKQPFWHITNTHFKANFCWQIQHLFVSHLFLLLFNLTRLHENLVFERACYPLIYINTFGPLLFFLTEHHPTHNCSINIPGLQGRKAFLRHMRSTK